MEPLTMTVTAAAKFLGFNRSTVAVLCRRGEIEYVPAVRPDGSRSRVHKRVVRASVIEWVRKNTIHNAEELKRAVDGRRKQHGGFNGK